MAERIVLDPAEVATSRTEFDISAWVGADGVDWGNAEIAAYMAEQERGSSPVDFRVPNRTITMPLVLKDRGGTAFATARSYVQAKAALFQREGGWVKRVSASGGTVFCDVVNATLKLPGSWAQAHKSYETDAELVLEAIPDFYQAEVDLGDNLTTTAAELVFTETGIDGDYPARCRIVVDEDDAEAQLGLIWGIRSRHYSAASTARLAYEAEALDPLDTAAGTVLSGASGGTVVRHGTLSTNWTPVLSTDLGGTAALTQTGTYRWWVRAYTTSGTAPQVRGVWDVGDLALPVENAPVALPGVSNFYNLDLGELRLDAPPVGTHRWQGQIQAKGETGGENVAIDKVWFVPADEGYGVLRAPFTLQPGLQGYVARDEFNQTAGTLTSKILPLGGTWSGAGDTDDFDVNGTGEVARTDGSDADLNTGRYGVAGSTDYAVVVVQADIVLDDEPSQGTVRAGVFCRYVDTNNWLWAGLEGDASSFVLKLLKRVSGTVTTLSEVDVTSALAITWTVRLFVDARGRTTVWFFPAGASPGDPAFPAAIDSVLATGGTLEDGKPGLYDAKTSAGSTVTRTYDNFLVWVPIGDAVLHSGETAELRTEGMFREDSAGVTYGPVSHVVGDLPRLPPSGIENRTVEVFLKASRGDFDELSDSGIDDLSCRVFYRPSWLFLPEP